MRTVVLAHIWRQKIRVFEERTFFQHGCCRYFMFKGYKILVYFMRQCNLQCLLIIEENEDTSGLTILYLPLKVFYMIDNTPVLCSCAVVDISNRMIVAVIDRAAVID